MSRKMRVLWCHLLHYHGVLEVSKNYIALNDNTKEIVFCVELEHGGLIALHARYGRILFFKSGWGERVETKALEEYYGEILDNRLHDFAHIVANKLAEAHKHR